MPLYTEEDVTNALNALVSGEYKSIRRAALVFQIPYPTLQYRLQKPKSRKESHVSQQILTPIEETTLENWIYRAAKLGARITLQLVKILASEIQSERSLNYDKNESCPISDRWIDRFRARHPRIKTRFSRTIDTARSTARKTGKRVALKGKHLLTKEDILKVVQDLGEGTKKKKTKKRRK
jgi:hypothetical protein